MAANLTTKDDILRIMEQSIPKKHDMSMVDSIPGKIIEESDN